MSMAADKNPSFLGARDFTDYNTRCTVLANMNGLGMSSDEHRQYLIHNAGEIMQQQREKFKACGFVQPMPERETDACTSSTCVVNVADPAGLGRGRGQGAAELSGVEPGLKLYVATLQ